MKKRLIQKLREKILRKENSNSFFLEANRVLLEGLAGSGKTYFINRAIEGILKNKDVGTNFILTNAHGDFSELVSKLLDLNYNLFVLNDYTDKKFVKIYRVDSVIGISIYEHSNEEIWDCLTTEPKTAVLVNVSNIGDKGLYCSLVTSCMKELKIRGSLEDIDLIAVFDDLEYLFDFYVPEKESNDEVDRLIGGLLEKDCDSDAGRFKIVFSGQNLLKMPAFSKIFEATPTWQYINFSTVFFNK